MKQNCECLNSSEHLYSRRMRFQNICFFLVVTTSLVSAAPAASVVREERAAVQPRVKRSPSLSLQQTDFKCSAPGIYADQQTGCQVFHFCQDGGRMDSFFCPNLTLFNQRFFVCDWSYNVDCDSAHLHFSLNDGLYESQAAQTISNAIAISPPVGLAQDEISTLHQPAEINNYGLEPTSLATSSSQVDTSIVLDNTIPTSPEQTKHSSPDTPQDSQEEETTEETPSDLAAGSEAASGESTASPVSDNPPLSPTVYYDDVADPEPSAGDVSYVSAPLPTYSSSLQEQSEVYDDADADDADDAVADPEPAGYYSDQSDPEPEAYIAGYSYDELSDPSYYSYGSESLDLTGSQSADPEPSGYDFYGLSDNNYPLYQSQGLVYDPSADPEPSSDPEFTPYDS